VFDQVMVNVIYLVKSQVQEISASRLYGYPSQSGLRALVVVGGFGESRYLIKQLENEPCLAGVKIIPCNRA
jgi:hypothetical protein